ncbi:beta-galactosidase [Sporolactobacillus shoreicorticis]|uniref:Beta-galactosidase n=1 Tax=Sporolactobacillus shoreicorticis TaxID=1923877 RepID=A0ABW5S1P0_9BACL|nr:beta-galactosidase [Sporolactobacillus shoreicorticis]MCO7126503.1 beta-galactosidase [Sporolactobacillus shoreicorticis]
MKQTPFTTFLFGGDWNPEQWPKEIWLKDMQILSNAQINEATINVFSWAQLQSSEDDYDFSTLDEIVRLLTQYNFHIVLATSTGALPAWMAKKYSDVARTDFYGRHHRYGERHNACPNSPTFQKYSARLAGKLAERYGYLECVVCWHISNEYGGACYCEHCAKAFRVWLKNKYRTLDALNEAWYTHFWGHTFYDWDEIVPPNDLGDAIGEDHTTLSGLSVDYRRFSSDSLLNNLISEKEAIRRFDPVTPITTNMMGTYKGLDYFKWAKELDIVSWDSYPAYDTPASLIAMKHDLMRGLKNGRPFMLMEQTPSQQNWQPYNAVKQPGQMRELSYQAIAHGADTIQYFQLRQSRGGTEKFHSAVISHADHDATRILRETAQLGQELAAYGTQFMNGQTKAKVAIIFDWDNYWAFEYSSGPNVELKYVDQVHRYYAALYRENVAVDMIPTDLTADDLGKYDLVIAPVLMMVKPGVTDTIEKFVTGGGTFVTTFLSGISDEHDNVIMGGYPGPFRKLCGIWAEEIDALPPKENVNLLFSDHAVSGSIVANISHLEGAQALAVYEDNVFYKGAPVVSVNSFGQGKAYYIGTVLDEKGMDLFVDRLIEERHLPHYPAPKGVEITVRSYDDYQLYFVINNTKEMRNMDTSRFEGKINLLNGAPISSQTILRPYDVLIVRD